MRSKAALAYQYGLENAGDFAITIGAIDYLLEEYEELIVISKYTEIQKGFEEAKQYLERIYGDRVLLYPGPFALERCGILRTLKSYVVGAFSLISPKVEKEYIDLFHEVEGVYINGGNLLRCESYTDWIRLQALLFPARLARKSGKKLFFLPQSTTRVNGLGFMSLYRELKYSEKVFIREQISMDYLKMRFPDVKFQLHPDVAFYIKDREKPKAIFKQKYTWVNDFDGRICVLTLRRKGIGDICELSKGDINKICVEIEKLAEMLK